MTFGFCSGLTSVTLGQGVEEIWEEAFYQCYSLEHIVTPPAVKVVDDTAFNYCSMLTSVEFCDEIEEFVSCEVMRGWRNRGIHVKSLSSYCFLVRCSIPAHFSGLALVSSWQANIYDMLRSIPTNSAEGMNAYFDAIDAKIHVYGNSLNKAPTIFREQFGLDYGIVLNILSFL